MPNSPLIFSGSVEPTLEIPACFTEHKEVYGRPDMSFCESVVVDPSDFCEDDTQFNLKKHIAELGKLVERFSPYTQLVT
jgi:hypothetical protein